MPHQTDARIIFHPEIETMEVDFSGVSFPDSASVNAVYDLIEDRIARTGEDKWFFLVNYAGMRIDSAAWVAWRARGKALNLAHSQGSVRFDTSPETRAQIERDAETDRFDPNLFASREEALEKIASIPSQRRQKRVLLPTHSADEIARRVAFVPAEEIMEVDLSGLTLAHSGDVDLLYDHLERSIEKTGRKWYFLVNYDGTRIYPEAWVAYARRGKVLNMAWSLGSVRYAPGSETEEDIRQRAESQSFRPNIRNTRAEALARIAEMKAEAETV